MTSLNERAWQRLDKVIKEKDRLNISIHVMECGATLVDAGVLVDGGLEAGLAMAETGMADLGKAQFELGVLNGIPWPWVMVRSDSPLKACFLSQAAHWPVQDGGLRAMGSGPACLLNKALDLGKVLGYEEKSDCALLVMETRQLPDERACRCLAEACEVKPDKLIMVVAPTSSLAGSTQIAARSIETGMHKLQTLGFDLHMVTSGMGRCPIAAPSGDDFTSMGRTNDLVMFACQVWLSIKGVSDADLKDLVLKMPASASRSYGSPFNELLKQAGGFYQIDPGLFAPAEVTLISLDSGKIFHAGGMDVERLEKVLKG